MNQLLTDTQYNIAKYVVLYVFPPLVLFFTTFTDIWSIPYGMEITKTLAAVGTLLGGILGISSKMYVPPTAPIDGILHVTETGEAYAAIEASVEDALERGTTTLAVRPLSG